MIPQRHIIAWRSVVPWVEDAQVEQDLVLSRVMVALFQQTVLNSQLVMRGGTAFNKLIVGSSHFEVDNPWFSGSADVPVYHSDEMFGSKMHALYHRKKGRDLFDLWLALDRNLIDATSVVQCFQHYSEHQDNPVSRAQFEANLLSKFQDRRFHEDLAPLLPTDTNYDPGEAIKVIMEELISRLPGDPWQGEVEPAD